MDGGTKFKVPEALFDRINSLVDIFTPFLSKQVNTRKGRLVPQLSELFQGPPGIDREHAEKLAKNPRILIDKDEFPPEEFSRLHDIIENNVMKHV